MEFILTRSKRLYGTKKIKSLVTKLAIKCVYYWLFGSWATIAHHTLQQKTIRNVNCVIVIMDCILSIFDSRTQK